MGLLLPAVGPEYSWQQFASATVTPGASNAEGSWTQLFSSVTNDVFGIWIWVSAGATSAQIKMHLLDIGSDPAGGTSYVQRVPDLLVGGSAATLFGGIFFYIPYFFVAGSKVGVRIQGSNATAGTVTVTGQAVGMPRHPEFAQTFGFAETVGTITSSRGVLVTPGVNQEEGSWTSIGTTTQPWKYVLPFMAVEDATQNAQIVNMDVAFGDATNKTIIAEYIPYWNQTTQEYWAGGPGVKPPIFAEVPSGTTIYARLSTSLATADSNYNCLVTGLG